MAAPPPAGPPTRSRRRGKVLEPTATFPLIAFWFGENYRGQGKTQRFAFHDDWDGLRLASQGDLHQERRIGMTLVDTAGRTWTIRRIWSTGLRTPAWKRALFRLFGHRDRLLHHVACEFDDRGFTPFVEVQAHVCACIEQNPDDWVDDEALAGEGGVEPLDVESVISIAKAAVHRARSIEEIFERLVEVDAR